MLDYNAIASVTITANVMRHLVCVEAGKYHGSVCSRSKL